jgi:hypothetical protein
MRTGFIWLKTGSVADSCEHGISPLVTGICFWTLSIFIVLFKTTTFGGMALPSSSGESYTAGSVTSS